MARYRKVDVRLWGDERVRKLSRPQPNGRDCWLYLLTAKETTALPGVIPAGMATMAETLRWPVEGFREAFREVEAQGLAKADWEAPLVWVPNAIKYNAPESPNVVRAWGKAWDELPDSSLKSSIYKAFRDFLKGLGEGFQKAFREAFREPLRQGSPNQEQEQEQEQEKEEKPLAAAAARPPAGSDASLRVSLPPTLPGSLPEALAEGHVPEPPPPPLPHALATPSPRPSLADEFRQERKAKATKPRAEPPADPRFTPLLRQLEAAHLELRGKPYSVPKGPRARDGAVLKALLAIATPEEILRRWRVAIDPGRQGFPESFEYVHELDSHWKRFEAESPRASPPRTAARAAWSTGILSNPVATCEACGCEGEVPCVWGHALCYPCQGSYQAAGNPWPPESEAEVLAFLGAHAARREAHA